MNPTFAKWLVLLVPLALWILFALLTRDWRRKRFFGLIAGADNRLSLSRLQAFAWTMVIFGTFAAATGRHGLRKSDKAKAVYEAALATEQARKADVDAATLDEAKAKASVAWKAAEKARDDAKSQYDRSLWVRIPPELLLLAGISLGTGVFASMIRSGGDGPPSVYRITVKESDADSPLSHNPQSAAPLGKYWLLIEGNRFGTDGDVRLDGRGTRRLFWDAAGTSIAVDISGDRRYRTLILDTRNGKLTFDLSYANQSSLPTSLQLGRERDSYELADLVRDDVNPRNLSLTKFQMFGWTLIAVVLYLMLFYTLLSADIEALPVLDGTLVALTGVSQLGYLGGKLASNGAAPPP